MGARTETPTGERTEEKERAVASWGRLGAGTGHRKKVAALARLVTPELYAERR